MSDVVTLEFKDNETLDCEVLGSFSCDGKDFMALIPVNGTNDVYLYLYEDLPNGFALYDIKEETLFDKAIEEFTNLIV